jgi:hypothetical protein
MKLHISHGLGLAAIALIAAICTCGTSGVVGGGGSGGSIEVPNGVTASVRGADGMPAASAAVHLRRSDYGTQLPTLAKALFFGADALTDSSGRFSISGIDSGNYCIEVNDGRSAVLFTCSLDTHDTLDLGVDTLRPYAAIAGTIDTAGLAGQQLFVQVEGLERLAMISVAGQFVINNLPAGSFTLRAITAHNTVIATALNVIVRPGKRTDMAMLNSWRFSKRLYLNTTASGAQVSGDVTDFPVLIRLIKDNYDFSQAKSGGEDVRFAKSDGSALSYEIERWDASAQTAEIWVKVDTVHGNDSTHFITMFWGNPNASSASGSAAVFDTANGFQGVWHMNEPSGAPARDASANHYDGMPSATAPIPVSGMIGPCQEFNGSSSCIVMPGTANGALNLPEDGFYTVSAWARLDSIDHGNTHRIIASKGDLQYSLEVLDSTADESSGITQWEFCETQDKAGWDITIGPLVTSQWTYVVGLRAGQRQYLFVNGQCVDSTIQNIATTNSPRVTTDNFVIGKKSNESAYYFKGAIDEVRISSRALSADWIKLSYMNQKEQDALVKFK